MADAARARTFERVARHRYDSSDETLYTPVTTSEVDALMGAKGRPLTDRYNLQHFLYRVRLTLYSGDESAKDLRRSVEAASEKKRRNGTPTTLSPLDAVRFASPEELSIIVGNISSSQLKALSAHVEDARARRDELVATLDAVRAAAHTIATRDDIPAPVRAEFADLLTTLPAHPAEVPEPKALELGRMAGLLDDEPAPPDAGPLPSGNAPLALGPGQGAAPAGSADRDHQYTDDLTQYGLPPTWLSGPGLIRNHQEQQ